MTVNQASLSISFFNLFPFSVIVLLSPVLVFCLHKCMSHSAVAKALYICVFFSVGQTRYFSLQICVMQVCKPTGNRGFTRPDYISWHCTGVSYYSTTKNVIQTVLYYSHKDIVNNWHDGALNFFTVLIKSQEHMHIWCKEIRSRKKWNIFIIFSVHSWNGV